MKDETYFDKALTNFKIVKLLISHKTDDEAYLNYAAYHLQQAVELSLKHLLENLGIKFSKTHSIGDLIEMLPENTYNDLNINNIMDQLTNAAGTITSFESEIRYVKNFRVTEKVIGNILKLVSFFIEHVNELNQIFLQSAKEEYREDNIVTKNIEQEVSDGLKTLLTSKGMSVDKMIDIVNGIKGKLLEEQQIQEQEKVSKIYKS